MLKRNFKEIFCFTLLGLTTALLFFYRLESDAPSILTPHPYHSWHPIMIGNEYVWGDVAQWIAADRPIDEIGTRVGYGALVPVFSAFRFLAYKLFGISIWAARFHNALFAFLTLITLYFFTRHFFSKTAALLATLFLTLNANFVILGRSGSVLEIQALFFSILALYFYLGAFEHISKRRAFMSGIIFGLATGSKPTAAFLLIPPVIIPILLKWIDIRRMHRTAILKLLGTLLLGFLCTMACLCLFFWLPFGSTVAEVWPLVPKSSGASPIHWARNFFGLGLNPFSYRQPLIWTLSIVGFLVALRKVWMKVDEAHALIVVTADLLFGVLFSCITLTKPHRLSLLYPSMAILAAIAVTSHRDLNNARPPWWVRETFAWFGCYLIFSPIYWLLSDEGNYHALYAVLAASFLFLASVPIRNSTFFFQGDRRIRKRFLFSVPVLILFLDGQALPAIFLHPQTRLIDFARRCSQHFSGISVIYGGEEISLFTTPPLFTPTLSSSLNEEARIKLAQFAVERRDLLDPRENQGVATPTETAFPTVLERAFVGNVQYSLRSK